MADGPLILRRAGAPRPVATPEAPVLVPSANRLQRGDSVVTAAGSEKISASTLPIYTMLPLHHFKP